MACARIKKFEIFIRRAVIFKYLQIREIKKKYAMVDVFPLKFNAKTERYPLSACQKFELNGRSLETAIRKVITTFQKVYALVEKSKGGW